MSSSVEPALVDLDDLCDACRARIAVPKRKKSWGSKVGSIIGLILFLWVVVAIIGIVTLALLRLAGLVHG